MREIKESSFQSNNLEIYFTMTANVQNYKYKKYLIIQLPINLGLKMTFQVNVHEEDHISKAMLFSETW